MSSAKFELGCPARAVGVLTRPPTPQVPPTPVDFAIGLGCFLAEGRTLSRVALWATCTALDNVLPGAILEPGRMANPAAAAV